MTNLLLNIDAGTIDWSRAQFALTAIYHWLFVPLTLGLAVIMGIMETCYYRTGKEFCSQGVCPSVSIVEHLLHIAIFQVSPIYQRVTLYHVRQ